MASDFSYGTSNFDEPLPWSNRKEAIWGIVISFLVMSWLCALFRFYVRFKIVNSPGWDDLFLAGTVLAMTAGSISTCLSVHYGLGQHFLLIDPANTTSYLLTFYISNASYNLATAFIKLALLFQFLRIFPLSTSPAPHRAAQALIVFTTLWALAYCFLAWFPCFPVRKIWLPDLEGGKCYGYGAPEPGPFVATYISHGAINVALDVLTLVVPLPLLLRTGIGGDDGRNTVATRLRVGGLFAVGIVVLGIAGWRLQTITSHQAATYPTRDPTWYAPVTFILAAVEVDMAAICASIPIFYPVVAAAATEQWGRIFITHEVRITREDRFPHGHQHNHHHHHRQDRQRQHRAGVGLGDGDHHHHYHHHDAAGEKSMETGDTSTRSRLPVNPGPAADSSAGLPGLDDTGPCASMTSACSSASPTHHHHHHQPRGRGHQDDEDEEAPIFDTRSARARSDVELGHLAPASPTSTTSLTRGRRSLTVKF